MKNHRGQLWLFGLIYTHRASGSQQYKRAKSWRWNISRLYELSISHTLSHSLCLSHHLSPKGRILEESLIIFTAHSIIPAKRLIHDLPQWRPTPLSQEGRRSKTREEERLPAQQQQQYASSICSFIIILLFHGVGWHLYREETCLCPRNTVEYLYSTVQNPMSSKMSLLACSFQKDWAQPHRAARTASQKHQKQPKTYAQNSE